MSLLPDNPDENRLLVIDGHSLIYRSFFALPKTLTTSDGQPANAIFGYTRTLLKVNREWASKYIALALDSKVETVRHKEYEDYKADRPEIPDELAQQIPDIISITEHLGIKTLQVEGYEADDVIATLVTQAKKRGMEALILSNDKDLMQLVDDEVKMVVPSNKPGEEMQLFGSDEVQEKLGVPPTQVLDYLSLKGDSSDNIPGVPQIGEVRARKLLDEFSSLEKLLNHLENVSSTKLQNILRNHKEEAQKSRNLIELHDDLELDIGSTVRGDPNVDGLREIFVRLEFGSLLSELPRENQRPIESQHLDTLEKLETFSEEARDRKYLSIYLLSRRDQPLEAEIGALSLATGEGKGYFLQLDDEFKDSKKESVLGRIKSLLEDPELKIMGHGLKTDSLLLDIQGIDLRGMVFDTMLASYLLKPSKRGHGLGKVAKTYLDRDLPALNQEENESLASEEKLTAGGRIVTENAKIAEVIWPLKGALEAKLQERDQLELLQRVEIPLIPVLKDMERKGIRFEPTRLEQGKRELQSRLEQLQQQIERLAGEQLNPSSPKQVREVLFDKLNLPVIERTKTGPSTNARVLEKLSDKHPLPEKVLEYREIDKLLNTYVNKLPDFVNEDTGRIHTSFNQTATATGRLSSSEPNLQNIPKGTETGKLLRKAFVPGPGKALIGADYSQIELRLLAHLSEDPELIETFQSGEDLHSKTAAQIYGVPAEEVTPQMRDTAKRVNFGIVYGITKYGLARDLGIEQEEAAKYIDRFFSLYPRAKEFIDEQIQEAEERKYAQTFLNRRRYLPNISSNNWNKRRHDQRNAINTPIQGGAADLMKLSMIEVHEDIRKGSLPGDLLLQVHDELILESPKDKTELACQKLRKVMEEVMDLKVPLKVDLKSGDNWGQL